MKKRQLACVWICCICFCCMILCGCEKKGAKTEEDTTSKHTQDILAMDTYMTLTAYGANGEKAIAEAAEEINRLDELLSVSSREGEVYIVNENGSEILSEDTAELVEDSLDIYEKTDGAFDITIYPLMKAWGFTDEKYKVPDADQIQKLLKKVNASKIQYEKETGQLTLPEGVQIDFGGIAKGFTSARVMDIFQKAGVKSGIVSLGGNVQTCGKKPDGSLWKIGVQNPDTNAADPFIGTLESSDQAVITSGGYERYFEENGKTYHHILDPKSGYPAESGLISVTIISSDGALADGLSTSLFILGKEKAVQFWKKQTEVFDMILQEEDGTLSITEGIEENFSSELDYQVIRR